MVILVLNSTVIKDTSCIELLDNFFTPGIDFNFFSKGLVIVFSILLGELPAYTVLIKNFGTTMSGKLSLGKLL